MNADAALRVIKLSGELDLGRKDEIRRALVVAGSEFGILVDLSESVYADSTALAELLRFRAEADAAHVPIAIVIGNQRFARLLQYAGLGDAFALFDDRAAALTHLAAARAL